MIAERAPFRSPHARGFTLVELIVAVGAVALLTIGIGQIFSSVGRLVGTGAAIAETDQTARAIEAQLRSDFDGLNRLREDETFLAIRSRRVRSVYLNGDQRDADRRDGVDATDPISRASIRRLDEIMFLSFTSGTPTMQTLPPAEADRSASAPIVRVYYGHLLRPQSDTAFDPANPPSDRNVPERKWVADGDFGQGPGEPNRFETSKQTTGRNQFSGDWILGRHALLLLGGNAAGPASGGGAEPAVPVELTYAPFARERESRTRSIGALAGIENTSDPRSWPRPKDIPWPRLLAFGRVDVCAQSPMTLRRWLEGVEPSPTGALPFWAPSDASAFDGGVLESVPVTPAPTVAGDIAPDNPLWQRSNAGSSARDVVRMNRQGLQGAIAGMFTRMQGESDPPIVDRRDPPDGGAVNDPKADLPMTALMDTRSTIGSRCSNFEVAWSDGTTWLEMEPYNKDRKDLNGDGVPEPRFDQGDLVWFDMNFFRTDGQDGTTSVRERLRGDTRGGLYPPVAPEEITEYWSRSDTNLNRVALRFPVQVGAYDTTDKGIEAQINAVAPEPEDEYLAIWGYRVATATPNPTTPTEFLPGYGGPWHKPTLIRVRMTLHDSQFRIEGGREYEFIFAIKLK